MAGNAAVCYWRWTVVAIGFECLSARMILCGRGEHRRAQPSTRSVQCTRPHLYFSAACVRAEAGPNPNEAVGLKRLYAASFKTELDQENSDMRDSEFAAKAAVDFRDRLLRRNWPGENGIGQFVDVPAGGNVGELAARARETGKLLVVWCEPRRGFVYPTFQFDRMGKLLPDVTDLLAILPSDDDRGGWRRTFWLYSSHAHLEDRSPAEVFGIDPARALDVAREEFTRDADTNW